MKKFELKQHQAPLFHFETTKNAAGVGFIVKSEIANHIQTIKDIYENHIISIFLKQRNIVLRITCVYLPCGPTLPENMLANFTTHLSSLTQETSLCLIIGDFNEINNNLLDTNTGNNSRRNGKNSILKLCQNKGFDDLFRRLHPNTRSYTNKSTNELTEARLDYILGNSAARYLLSEIYIVQNFANIPTTHAPPRS